MAKTKAINLLPQKEFEASILGRILAWAMGTFRIIVILTELIVMGAFLSRFWLDAQNSDLTDAIKTRSAQITSQSDFEKEFRGVQTKLTIIKSLSSAPKATGRIQNISALLPSDIVLSSASFQESSVLVKGTADSEISIGGLIASLKGSETVKSVNLVSAGSSEENPSQTIFVIKINY